MSDHLLRRHGLESFLQSLQQTGRQEAGIDVHIPDNVTHVNLRGNAANNELMIGAEKVLGQPLPVEPNTITNSEHRIYWLGPNEWLIVSTAADASALAGRLHDGLGNLHSSVNDISGGQVAFSLLGNDVRDVLSKGCTIDFHADAFKPGDCAQSGLAKAGVLIGCIESPGTFEVIVRRSFADYLARWLQHAAREFGIRFRLSE